MDSHWAATKGASARRRGAAWTAVFFPPRLDGDGGSGRPALLVEAEERFQGLQLEAEAAEGGGVFPAGVEEGPDGGGEVELEVEQLGDRPCKGEVDTGELTRIVKEASEKYGYTRTDECGSTDCNIPLSMGIPAVCFGVYEGHGAHTREEWVDIESTRDGMKILAEVVLSEMK